MFRPLIASHWIVVSQPARQEVLMAGKFNARMKSQSGDDLIVSTSERSSQLNAPVSINFNKKNNFSFTRLMWDYPVLRTGWGGKISITYFSVKILWSNEGSSFVFWFFNLLQQIAFMSVEHLIVVWRCDGVTQAMPASLNKAGAGPSSGETRAVSASHFSYHH